MNTMEYILEYLKRKNMSPIELSEVLHKTRHAIYCAVNKLKSRGFDIEMIDGKYILKGNNENIDKYIERSIEKAKLLEEQKNLKITAFERHMINLLEEALEDVSFANVPYISKSIQTKSEQAVVMVLSDIHYGRITPSYNSEIALKRLERHIDAFMNIVNIESTLYNNIELDIFLLGDMIDGETIFPTQPFNIDKTAIQQVINLGEALAYKIVFLSQYFPIVNVYCVYGNHGRISKYNAVTSNWDNFLYLFMDVMLKDNKRINFYYPDGNDKLMIAKIYDYKFLLMHGDIIKMRLRTPFYGIIDKLKEMYQAYGGIDYMVMGHFHHHALGMEAINVEWFINGSYLTDDDYSLHGFGSRNINANQIIFGVHRKYGVTWRYPIYLR